MDRRQFSATPCLVVVPAVVMGHLIYSLTCSLYSFPRIVNCFPRNVLSNNSYLNSWYLFRGGHQIERRQNCIHYYYIILWWILNTGFFGLEDVPKMMMHVYNWRLLGKHIFNILDWHLRGYDISIINWESLTDKYSWSTSFKKWESREIPDSYYFDPLKGDWKCVSKCSCEALRLILEGKTYS